MLLGPGLILESSSFCKFRGLSKLTQHNAKLSEHSNKTRRQNTVQDDDVNSCGYWGDVRSLGGHKLDTPQLESFVRVSNTLCDTHQQALFSDA